MPLVIEMLPDEWFFLQKEMARHPELLRRLEHHPPEDMEIRLAEVASYCGVILDGFYTPEDQTKLCGILIKKLELMHIAPSIITIH
jgi:hypothetical protein